MGFCPVIFWAQLFPQATIHSHTNQPRTEASVITHNIIIITTFACFRINSVSSLLNCDFQSDHLKKLIASLSYSRKNVEKTDERPTARSDFKFDCLRRAVSVKMDHLWTWHRFNSHCCNYSKFQMCHLSQAEQHAGKVSISAHFFWYIRRLIALRTNVFLTENYQNDHAVEFTGWGPL